MLKQLRLCISTTQQILADLESSSCLSRPPLHRPESTSFLSMTAQRGIPKIHHSRIPAALASKLHEVTQSHFSKAILALQSTHGASDLATVQELALQLKRTYTTVYERKVADVVAAIHTKAIAGQKQPYANDILLYAFEQSQSPSKRERQQLSALTGLTLEQVRVWFQNRRQRNKKRAPELQPRTTLQLDDVLARVAAYRKAADEDFDDDDDSGYCSDSSRDRSLTPFTCQGQSSLTVPSTGPRSYPAPYVRMELSTEFRCEAPAFYRTAATHAPVYAETTSTTELIRLMSRLTLRQRRQTARSSTVSTSSTTITPRPSKPAAKGSKAVADSGKPARTGGDASARKKVVRKDPDTGRKLAGRRAASAASGSSPSSSASLPLSPQAASLSSSPATDTAPPRKRLGPLRRKPAGKPLARQASESSVASTLSSDSSRSTSYSSDFSLASDSSFTSVDSAPVAGGMDCFQPQQHPQFDPLAAFDFTQLFSSQPSDSLPQPVADFELPPDLLAGLQMPTNTAALPSPESSDFMALLNDPTIQDLLQSVQDMDVVAPQQMQESFTFNNTLDLGSVDTSAFLDISSSTLPTFDAMFGLDATSFQDTLWNSPGFSLPITA